MPLHQTYLSSDLANPLGAIDIGSNSIRLIIAEGLREGKYRVLDDEKESTRLSASLSKTGRLDPDAVNRSLAVLKRMKQIADGYQVRQLRAIATCAVREAEDGPEFCRRAREEIGLEIEVISAKLEARFAYESVRRNFDLGNSHVVVADIGGGSTELIAASNNVIEGVFTTPLGAVRLTELHGTADGAEEETFEKLLAAIDRTLQKRVGKPPFIPQALIGTGGTFTALATLLMASKGQVGLPVRGYQISRAEARHMLDLVRKTSLKLRRDFPGMSPDRVDIIVAGLAVIDRLLHYFRINRLQVHTGGVRDGLLLTMVDEYFPLGRNGAPAPHDREAAVLRFAGACGVDVRHGEQVARLAGSIFDQMKGAFAMPAEDRELLVTAARLQDVGYLINYEDHHKHSYHLILNSDLPGFRPQDLQMVASVARYHRGSEPKKKHEDFVRLSEEDQVRVKRLTSILRVAGGLDRSHSQQVTGVTVVVAEKAIGMAVHAGRNPDLDIWGARRRTELFEKVFKRKLTVEWQPTTQAVV
jgi:exopolyphosphatase/guanosine-5'-triphosphate,3'-diphosphate pyrophosphatase